MIQPDEFHTAVVKEAREAGGPVERALAAHAWHTSCQASIRDLARIRRQAVREMYAQGYSWADIGAVLGVTRQRAHQLARGA